MTTITIGFLRTFVVTVTWDSRGWHQDILLSLNYLKGVWLYLAKR
ncbi:hypothetical protein [Flagellimonas ochracea]|nr:hypothetical protein [Allomuricauda ochracea]